MEVLGESIEGPGELIGAEGGGGKVEAEDYEWGMEGKGRQNMVFRHHCPFQKTTKTGGGEDTRGAAAGAVTIYEPVL